MTYRVDYRETVALSESEHQDVISAIASWVANTPDGETRRFPFYQRHRERGETEIQVIISGVSHADIPSTMDEIKSGLDSLPGEWPDPTNNCKPTPE